MIELLKTKFYLPRPRPAMVSRPRLADRLNAGLDKKLTLITAPAGFGKTTLLSEWISQSPRCVTWLSLDDDDNDPTRFWTYFISSLQQLRSDLGASALALLQSAQAPPISSILTAIINDLVAFPDVFASVLDDYHVIDSPLIHEGLSFLITHQPKNMHLVLTTRVDPPLPVARLRARSELNEMRAFDLRFTPDETAVFLYRATGLNLSPEEIATLEARTEGWIAGLQIAALSMQGQEDISGFIRAFSGSHRHILGYLVDEVINRLPEDTQNFLLLTSILDRLCGPLCDAVTGNSNGQAILENLERTNLFITPLDNDGRWYRYHHLFAEVLQLRLNQGQTPLIPEFHRRAGKWLLSEGMREEAIHQLLAGGEYVEAASLIENLAGDMLRRGSSASLVSWLDAIPNEVTLSHPRLCLARGWTRVWGSEFSLERAEEWAQLAQKGMTDNLKPGPDSEGELFTLRALIAADRVDLPLARKLSSLALERLPADSPWLSVAMFCLGATLFAAGEYSTASPVLAETIRLSQADGALYTQLIAADFVADIEVFRGHLSRAIEMYGQVLTWSNTGIPQKGALIAHAGLANVLCEKNHLEEALTHIRAGLVQLEQVGGPGITLWLYRTLARIHRATGSWADALESLNRAYQSGENAQVPYVMAQAAALRAQVLLAQGDIEAGADWMANSGLDPNDPVPTFSGEQELYYLTIARVLNAQGRRLEALMLLKRMLDAALAEDRLGSAIVILAIHAVVYQAQGNKSSALEALERAMALAEPEGFIRSFVDEGEPMRLLLLDYQFMCRAKIRDGYDSEPPRLLAYTEKLLAAFSRPEPVAGFPPSALPESLSEREVQVLRMIARGFSNEEIASTLVIAISTVKSHINSLYGKLGIHRRTQAVSIARDLGVLSE